MFDAHPAAICLTILWKSHIAQIFKKRMSTALASRFRKEKCKVWIQMIGRMAGVMGSRCPSVFRVFFIDSSCQWYLR